jgi:hypothetical protein
MTRPRRMQHVYYMLEDKSEEIALSFPAKIAVENS